MPVVTENQIVSLHNGRGVTLWQFLPEDYTSCTWGRAQRDASGSDLTVPPIIDADRLPDIVPWLHWMTVWDGDRDVVLWTGPIQKAAGNRSGLRISAKDHSAYLSRLRNPITKQWNNADPAWIAGELWRSLIEQEGINTRPIVRADPEGERFDFQVTTDEAMLDQTIGDLVGLGLRWTVVSGTPIIGPLPMEPTATLGDDDFLGDGVDFIRDGTAVYNDVLVRGPSNLARQRVPFYGLNLQTIANVDSLSGVSNVNRAAQQYLRQSGSVRTQMSLGQGTLLHPDAPVHIDELMPSARFVVEANGMRQLVELTDLDVERQPGAVSVKVTMNSVEEKIELLEKAGQQGQTTLGRQPV